jgi:predicted RNA binding protein YcfA (HicA-like mRNA interferase family)
LTKRTKFAWQALFNTTEQPNYMKVREAIKLIEDDGWYFARQNRSSHRQYKHPQKRGLVTIAGKPNDDLAPGTKNSILKQSGLK